MRIIKKIWNDSVASKVIATFLSPYVIIALAAIIGFFKETGYWADLKRILLYNVSIPVWIIPLIIAVLFYAIQWVTKKKEDKNVIRHKGPYITFKGCPQDQCYCAVCWDNNHNKVQLPHYYGDTFKCPICKSEACYDV